MSRSLVWSSQGQRLKSASQSPQPKPGEGRICLQTAQEQLMLLGGFCGLGIGHGVQGI